MIMRWLTSWLRQSLRACGLDVHRIQPVGASGRDRASLTEMLHQISRTGLFPNTVVDVGAAYGSFTRECVAVFPGARYLLIEPLVEYQSSLAELAQRLPSSHYICAAAASQPGKKAINVHPDLVGSSLLREVEAGTDVNGVPRSVPLVTIDRLVKELVAEGPFVLKVDVQGAELEVLRGAETMLRETEYVILEVSFFQFFEGGPEFFDIITYMKGIGFVVYDIMGLQYRPLDCALSQADLAFVKESGPFRRTHFYATPSQRTEQNRRIQAQLNHWLARRR